MSFRTAGVNNACWKDQDDPVVCKHTSYLILFAKLHDSVWPSGTRGHDVSICHGSCNVHNCGYVNTEAGIWTGMVLQSVVSCNKSIFGGFKKAIKYLHWNTW